MEDSFSKKKISALDRELQDKATQAINVSLEKTTDWQMIPSEVKVLIFSLIPQEIKNLLVINHECYALTKDSFFLKAIAVFIIDKNIIKAVNLYAQACEEDNTSLAEALLDARLDLKLIAITDLSSFEKESSMDSNFNSAPLKKIEDNVTGFIKAIIKLSPQAARTLFINAAGNNASLINIFFDNNIDIDLNEDYNSFDMNALMQAAYTGHTENVILLTDKGAQVNAKNKTASTPLIFSGFNGHTETSEHLLNLGADINARNIHGMTPLTLAVMDGSVELINLLLQRKAHIEGKPYSNSTYDYRESPLIVAAKFGQEEALNMLLNFGAQVNATDKDGNNALHFATLNSHGSIVKKLVEAGIQINAKNKNRHTSLMIGAKLGNLEMVKMLLEIKVDPLIQTHRYKKGKTALMYACLYGQVNVVEALLPVSNINAEDEHGKTALLLVLNKVKIFTDFNDIKAQNYLRIIELLNNKPTHEGSLSRLDRVVQSAYDTLDDQNLPNVIIGITASLTALALTQFYLKKF